MSLKAVNAAISLIDPLADELTNFVDEFFPFAAGTQFTERPTVHCFGSIFYTNTLLIMQLHKCSGLGSPSIIA